MSNYLLFVLPAIALVCLHFCVVRWVLRGGKTKYRYDPRNPYRRWCNDCGQEENVYSHPLGPDRWEVTGRLPDKPCLAHAQPQGDSHDDQ